MRRRLALLAAVLLAFGLPGLARADDGNGLGLNPDANSAIAFNTEDGSSLFKLAFAIRRVAGDVVDQQNVAVAYASCTSCQTTAIAIEIVLVTGDPNVASPENVAVAVNESCHLCDTFATAYQFVVSTGGPVHFTSEGMRELQQIRHELRQLKGLSNAEIRARLPALIARLKQVLQTQLVPVKPGENAQGNEGEGDQPSQGATPNGGDTTPGETTGGQDTITTPTTDTSTDTTETVTTDPTTTTTGP
ncbi:MAG: putative peptide zinc metalloprotease protein [Gaiellaceae bacterium]|nr:putative peptide zinc metalloprotease protein [Gaiellaceae bacterium]